MTTEQSGQEFRAKAEAAFAEVKALRQHNAELVASQFIYVKPEDLLQFEPSQISEKAIELEAAGKEAADTLLRKALASRGVAEADLEKVLANLADPAQPVVDDVAARMATLGTMGGSVPKVKAETPVDAKAKILAGLAASTAK